MSYEWPLLIFTFLTAASVGAFICGGGARLLIEHAGGDTSASERRFPAAAFFGWQRRWRTSAPSWARRRPF